MYRRVAESDDAAHPSAHPDIAVHSGLALIRLGIDHGMDQQTGSWHDEGAAVCKGQSPALRVVADFHHGKIMGLTKAGAVEANDAEMRAHDACRCR